jgi:nitrogen fixation-related uncharacterized protein
VSSLVTLVAQNGPYAPNAPYVPAHHGYSLPTAAIVLIVVAVVLVALILGTVLWQWANRGRRYDPFVNATEEEDAQRTPTSVGARRPDTDESELRDREF